MARHTASLSFKDKAVDLAYAVPSVPLFLWLYLDMRRQLVVAYFKTHTIKEILVDTVYFLILSALVLWTPFWMYVSYLIYF